MSSSLIPSSSWPSLQPLILHGHGGNAKGPGFPPGPNRVGCPFGQEGPGGALDMMKPGKLRLTYRDGRKVEAVIPEAVQRLSGMPHDHELR